MDLTFGLQKFFPRRRSENDHVFESQRLTVAGFCKNMRVIGAAITLPQEQRLYARLAQSECQFVRSIGGVDVDQNDACPRATQMQHHPLDAVGGP